MTIRIGKRFLEVYTLSGTAYGVQQSSNVVYREEYSSATQRGHLAHSNRDSTTWWIKLADGTETQLKFPALVPLRDGHEATVVYLGWRDEETMKPVAVLNAATNRLLRYSAKAVSDRFELGGSFMNGCLLPVLGFLAVPAIPFWASLQYGKTYGTEKMGMIGFGVGLAILIAVWIHTKKASARGLNRFETQLRKEIHSALGWKDGVPGGVTVTTLEERSHLRSLVNYRRHLDREVLHPIDCTRSANVGRDVTQWLTCA